MRVATLALLATSARALVISRTAKFTVISRAMGDFTTTPEERAEAAAMRKTAGASTVAPTVASCAIGQGIQKYVLVQAGDRYFADLANKKIAIYGHSIGFPWQGEFRHDHARPSSRARPDAEVTSNEGIDLVSAVCCAPSGMCAAPDVQRGY
ncbi:hypothetical protein JL722_12452 [Aureococcus anophagefferens]|nr:hypothetical protein JL722_12452 [Aureococcus anophagefferens]